MDRVKYNREIISYRQACECAQLFEFFVRTRNVYEFLYDNFYIQKYYFKEYDCFRCVRYLSNPLRFLGIKTVYLHRVPSVDIDKSYQDMLESLAEYRNVVMSVADEACVMMDQVNQIASDIKKNGPNNCYFNAIVRLFRLEN